MFLLVNEIQAVGDRHAGAVATPDHALSDTTVRRIRESVPESTRRVYAGDRERFVTWCSGRGRQPLPATPQTLADYTSQLADEGKAASTIERALSAILTLHEAGGHPKPNTKLAQAVMRKYRAELADAGRGIRKAPPVTITVLRAMVETCDLEQLAGVRDRALIVIGFALGARRSELAALNIADLTVQSEGLQVTIRRSKTDKDSTGRVVALPYGSHPQTCPVRTAQAWLDALAAHDATTGSLFRRIDRYGNLGRAPHGRGDADGRLTGQAVALIVRRAAKRAGLDAASAFTGHSLRRGFATAAYTTGADPLRIARHGGWKDGSATLAGYIEDVDRWKSNPLADIGL